MLKKYLILLFFFTAIGLFGQSNFGAKLLNISFNPIQSKSNNYINTLDKNGNFLFEPGLLLSYEYFVNDFLVSLRFQQGIFYDANSRIEGISQISLRARILQIWKHSLNIGIEPTIFYRQSWVGLKNYDLNDGFSNSTDLQYKLQILNADIEYNFYLNRKTDLSISLNYVEPARIFIATGMRYWISKKLKKRKPCNSCPTF
ncbi:MAG: hypothetical protein HN704_14860 [Bacteroidetes bacterium]|jgi:hypothetical protein|nr:hypothetical protein [Bacteroidota bacterium]MBT6686715.1 hypothetical protein [Bacteroidota bacterium]MBT7143239.1 hypothetical protein [Bacteroidota bacterium]MBT7492878.1 hypothetical protein [Bacteroidota bacterium]